MIFRNIDFHNVCEIIPLEDGAFTWRRIPLAAEQSLERGEKSFNASRACTGVELRFVMKSDTVTIRMAKLDPASTVSNSVHVYRGGYQIGLSTYVGSEYQAIVIRQPSGFENTDTMRMAAREAGRGWDPSVIRVIFNRGNFRILEIIGDVAPPPPALCPAKTLLSYGSSITHGAYSHSAPTCWASLAAHHLKTDHLNLGFAGSCWMEPEVLKYLSQLGQQGKWDIATLELGINCLSWEEEKIYQRVRLVLQEVAAKNQDKPIFVISPFLSRNDLGEARKAARWREIIAELVAEAALPNVTYINGMEIFNDPSLLSSDLLHPSAFGHIKIAENMYARLKHCQF